MGAIKFGVLGLLCAGAYAYATTIFALPKKEYNALHPYTAVIPITLYILRNLFPTLRRWHMHLFEYLGKITLETYIAQFHVWMATTGVNGPRSDCSCSSPATGRSSTSWPRP